MKWEKVKLGSILETLTDYHANGSYEKLKENVELLNEPDYAVMIRTKNLESNDFQQDLKYITQSAYEFLKKSKVFSNDILMNKIANAGSVYLMPEIEKPASLAMNLFLIRVAAQKANQIFIFYQLKFRETYIKQFASGTATQTITKEAVRNLEIFLPCIETQNRIASFLGAIDTRLTQLRRKQELLQTYKRGVMQKIFSQEIRFKGAIGSEFPDWERKKLSDIANIVGGGTPDTYQEEYWGGQIQWFTPTELRTKYISTSVRTITSVGLERSSAKILPKGTLLFSSRATVGDVSITLKECATNQGFQSFIVNAKSINEFLYYWIAQNKKTFLRRASGSTFLEISKQEISKIIIPLPHIEEQKKIANFLTAIDKKIEALSRQIDQTEKFKKGLLQKMFV